MPTALPPVREYRSIAIEETRKSLRIWKECKAAEKQIAILSDPSSWFRPIKSIVFLWWVTSGQLRLAGRSSLVRKEVVWLMHFLFWLPIVLSHVVIGFFDVGFHLWSFLLDDTHAVFGGLPQPAERDTLEYCLGVLQSFPMFVYAIAVSVAAAAAYYYTGSSQARGFDLNHTCRFDIFDFAGGYITRILSHSVHLWVTLVLYASLHIPGMWSLGRFAISATLGYATSTAFGFTFMNVIDYARAAGEDWKAKPTGFARMKSIGLLLFAVAGGWLSFAQITDWITDRRWWFASDTLVLFGGYAALFFHNGLVTYHLHQNPLIATHTGHKHSGDPAADAEDSPRRGDGGTWDFKPERNRYRKAAHKVPSLDPRFPAPRERSGSSYKAAPSPRARQFAPLHWPILYFNLGWLGLEDADRGVWDVSKRFQDLKDKLEFLKSQPRWQSGTVWGSWLAQWMGLGRMYGSSATPISNIHSCSSSWRNKVAAGKVVQLGHAYPWAGAWLPGGFVSAVDAADVASLRSAPNDGVGSSVKHKSSTIGKLVEDMFRIQQPARAGGKDGCSDLPMIADIPTLTVLSSSLLDAKGRDGLMPRPQSPLDTGKRNKMLTSSPGLEDRVVSSFPASPKDAPPRADIPAQHCDKCDCDHSEQSGQQVVTLYDYHPYTQPWLTHSGKEPLRPTLYSATNPEANRIGLRMSKSKKLVTPLQKATSNLTWSSAMAYEDTYGTMNEDVFTDAGDARFETTTEKFHQNLAACEEEYGVHFVHVNYVQPMDWEQEMEHSSTWDNSSKAGERTSPFLPGTAEPATTPTARKPPVHATTNPRTLFQIPAEFKNGISPSFGMGAVDVGGFTHSLGIAGYELGVAPYIHVGDKGQRRWLGWLWLIVIAQVFLIGAIVMKLWTPNPAGIASSKMLDGVLGPLWGYVNGSIPLFKYQNPRLIHWHET